jgi:branched-chain amino acid aminotransferase
MDNLWLSCNGRIVAPDEARVSPLDRGVLYGDGLFETMRAYGGRVFRLEAHLERLAASAPIVRFGLPWTAAELAQAVTELLAVSALADAYLRLTVLRGEGPPGPAPGKCPAPHYFVIARPLQSQRDPPQAPLLRRGGVARPYPARCYQDGATAIVASTRQNEGSPLARVKSTSTLNHVLAIGEAKDAGVDEALLLNNRGELAEGATSNLFIARGDTLLTPPVECGCLPGITRAALLERAPALGFTVALRPVTLADLLAADEAFLTNSLMEVMPLVRVAGHPIGSGRPGPVTARIASDYRAQVEQELSLRLD